MLVWVLVLGSVVGVCQGGNQEEYPHLTFHSCALPGWSCLNNTEGISSTISSVSYNCTKIVTESNVTIEDGFTRTRTFQRPVEQTRYRHSSPSYTEVVERDYIEPKIKTISTEVRSNFTLRLSEWEELPIITLTVRGCGSIHLEMNTEKNTKLATLRMEDIYELNFRAPTGESNHNPPNLAFRNINFIPVLPTYLISKNCTKSIEFKNVKIGLVNTRAVSVKTPLSHFLWENVDSGDMMGRSVALAMAEGAKAQIRDSRFRGLRPLSLTFRGGSALIENTKFDIFETASIVANVRHLNFTKNVVCSPRQGAPSMYVTSPDIIMEDNTFGVQSITSVLYWTTHKGSEIPPETNFIFKGNKLRLANSPPAESFLEKCYSNITLIERGSKCSRIINPNENLSIESLEQIIVVNVRICGNECDEHDCGFPSKWQPAQAWNKYLCPEQAIVSTTARSHPETTTDGTWCKC